ncbi:MAG: glycoside hydrolase family 16 protein [Verrucomicrobiales bacterium]|nr:glycoside hydrolase family 16 protein [Verrucomicrobiales bacterium]
MAAISHMHFRPLVRLVRHFHRRNRSFFPPMAGTVPLVSIVLPGLMAAHWGCLPGAFGQEVITPQVSATPTIHFPAKAGEFCQVERSDSAGPWIPVGMPVKGTGAPVTILDPSPSAPSDAVKAEYRIRLLRDQWVQVWADEFDGVRLDPAKWSKEENGYGGGNNERQYYSTDPKFCQVSNGTLKISLHREPHTTSDGKTQPYSSARIRTLERGDWQYGRIEVRAKVPGGEGIWPAVWMLSSENRYGGWASSGEIDILESRGNRVGETLGTLHFGGPWPNNRHKGETYLFPGKNAAEDFHTYAVIWKEDEIQWEIDGKVWQTQRKESWDSAKAPDNPRAPFDQPFHLIINLAADGGFFAGTGQDSSHLPDSAFPQVLEIDHVRVSQWAGPGSIP